MKIEDFQYFYLLCEGFAVRGKLLSSSSLFFFSRSEFMDFFSRRKAPPLSPQEKFSRLHGRSTTVSHSIFNLYNTFQLLKRDAAIIYCILAYGSFRPPLHTLLPRNSRVRRDVTPLRLIILITVDYLALNSRVTHFHLSV